MPQSWHWSRTTVPNPIWATGASEISPIQPRTVMASTTMAMITP